MGKKHSKLNERGNTLLVVLIAQAMMALTFTAFTKFYKQGDHAVRGVNSKMEMTQLILTVQQLLNNSKFCNELFQNKKFFYTPDKTGTSFYATPIPFQKIDGPTGKVPLIEMGQRFAGNTKIEGIQLKGLQQVITNHFRGFLTVDVDSPNTYATPKFKNGIALNFITRDLAGTEKEIVGCGVETANNVLQNTNSGGMDCSSIVGGYYDMELGKCRILIESVKSDPSAPQEGQIWMRDDI